MIDRDICYNIIDTKIQELPYIEVISILSMLEYIEYDLHDYHNNIDEFERDIEELLYNLDTQLPENILFSHKYSDKYSICGISGEKVPDYHCYIKIYEKGL